jgi:RNA polymerase sigma-70 factor (ECF subfamily)
MSKDVPDAGRWLTAARAGSADALGQALDACRDYLLLIAQQELDPNLRAKGGASDIVQETFLEAQRGFDNFQGTSDEELRAWLRRILLNNLGDFTRRYRGTDMRAVAREVGLNGESSSAQVGANLAADVSTPSTHALEQEEAELLVQAMNRLSEDYRQVILLRYRQELSFEEIGARMNRSVVAVRKLWARAVVRLREEFTKPS